MARAAKRKILLGHPALHKTPPRFSPRALRRKKLSNEQVAARKKYPQLDELIDEIAEQLRGRDEGDRYSHLQSLKRAYKAGVKWKKKKFFKARAQTIAALQGETLRKNSTTFGVFLKAVCKRANSDLKTGSRWAGKLNDAMKQNVALDDISDWLRGIAHD